MADERDGALSSRILQVLRAGRRGNATLEQLRRATGASGRDLESAVSALEESGEVVRMPRKRLALAERSGLRTGTVRIERSGRALVILDVPAAPLVLERSALRPAMDRDRVLVEETPYSRGGLHHAKIHRVLERGRERLIGVAAPKAPRRILPLDERVGPYLVLLAPDSEPAPLGQAVATRIVEYPSGHRDILVRVEEVLGELGLLGTEIRTVCASLGIEEEFDDEVLAEAAAFGEPSAADLAGRVDLRQTLTITVDPADAKDHDDAVSVQKLDGPGGGYRLIVSIADVSHYVRPGSRLDDEAFERSTSVYFPGTSVPMLPERLSGDLASLHPGVDRLAVSAFLDIDERGRVRSSSFARSVIHSVASLTYEQVQSVLDGGEQAGVSAEVRDALGEMGHLAALLCQRRMQRGAIDMDLPESVIELDERGEVGTIRKRPRLFAHRLIEEFMLAANEAVATRIDRADQAFLYRIHERPDDDAISELAVRVKALGLRLEREGALVEPAMFQHLLAAAADSPFARQVNVMVLRTMTQARYSAEKGIHFGLASRCYTHFTSPIRRYPDIVAHRALLAVEGRDSAGGGNAGGCDASDGAAAVALAAGEARPARAAVLPSREALRPVAEHTSKRERRAMEAERDVAKGAAVLYMQRWLGKRLEGTVSAVDRYGFNVELDVAFVEGFVHVGRLREYFDYVAERMELQSRVSSACIRIGDRIKVRVAALDLASRRIDLEPA
ncbi:MAG: VacB/RNase II family 3'-5' exoribonuclease [Deltaproteobacteria bacterium]|nr:VacB/RNase II family 3'-5' exoribonuclease [Deltaproteobacteria bacterium]